ncbi:MAG: dehypoxanthine futalosine cyclase [Planctomycetes bacterium]|nr:dehypoxanthine futalosine cyclase [Planctomycetota bacterium]
MIAGVLDKAMAGVRISVDEGLRLLQSRDVVALGRAADAITRRLHPESYRTYNIDRNINYTNICTSACRFCAFFRPPGHPEGYVLSRDALWRKIEETVRLGGNQILLQGGLHPTLEFSWYEQLVAEIKTAFPHVNIHGFSPPEIIHFSKAARLPLRSVLERLKRAGLGSIPGGGAEILVDRVRCEVSPNKASTENWLDVMRQWHNLGRRSSATMMFGHAETLADRIEHLQRLRQLQDETRGFTAFICWTFQPDNTRLSHLPHASPFEYLRTLAVCRIFLDNFANVQASWVTQGLKIGQLSMLFGANDMGSLMIEENVVAQAGTVHTATLTQIRDAIAELGYVPRQRDVTYQLVGLDQEMRALRASTVEGAHGGGRLAGE